MRDSISKVLEKDHESINSNLTMLFLEQPGHTRLVMIIKNNYPHFFLSIFLKIYSDGALFFLNRPMAG